LLIIKTINNNELNNLKFIVQCPQNSIILLKKSLNDLKIDYEIKTFFYDIDNILSKTDIAITRAGAGTINDLIRYKVPSIIFPIPNSIYNHQYYNAKFLLNKKACIVINENNFNLYDYSKGLNKLLIEKKYFETMKESISKIILPDTNKLILKTILHKDNE
jgi:UDP-N-acetylglucosamine:LPS N-acetylglucosamine transferase